MRSEPARSPADTEFAQAIPEKRDCITRGARFGLRRQGHQRRVPVRRRLTAPSCASSTPRFCRETAHCKINDERGGVWRSHTQFNCDRLSKKINLTDTITSPKRALLFPGETKAEGAVHRGVAQLLQRISGVLLLFYLLLHVLTIHNRAGTGSWTRRLPPSAV